MTPAPASPEDIKLAAKRGAYWLDHTYPEWLDAIDTTRLNLASTERCVLGQLMGGGTYLDFVDALRGADIGVVLHWLLEHGFTMSMPMPTEAHWNLLTDAWKEQIRERRGE